MADLSTLKPAQGVELRIKHPATEAFVGVRIFTISPQDPKMRSIRRMITDQRIKLEAKGKYFKAEDLEQNQRNFLFAAMTGWDWGKDDNGEEATFEGGKPDFDKTTVNKVFDSLPWMQSQLDEFLAEDKNFFAN